MGRSKGPLGPVLHTFVFAGPKGTLFDGALVAQLLPYQHHPDAVCALVACDHILAAHPLFRGAAGGHAPLALGAAACVGAGVLVPKRTPLAGAATYFTREMASSRLRTILFTPATTITRWGP